MKVLETIKNRRSIRKFTEKPLSKEHIDAIAEAMIWAPSGGNLQARRFFFVFNADVRKQLEKAALGQKYISQAPLAIVCCADTKAGLARYGERGTQLYSIQDATASVMNAMLVCEEMGLGTVWIGAFNEAEVTKALSLPEHLRPITIIPVGHPADRPKPTPRVERDKAITTIE